MPVEAFSYENLGDFNISNIKLLSYTHPSALNKIKLLKEIPYVYLRKNSSLDHYSSPEYGFEYGAIRAFEIDIDPNKFFKVRTKNYDILSTNLNDYQKGKNGDFLIINPNGAMYVVANSTFHDSFQPYLPLGATPASTTVNLITIKGIEDKSLYSSTNPNSPSNDFAEFNFFADSVGKGKLVYNWIVEDPNNIETVLTNTSNPNYKAKKAGDYKIKLTITDSYGIQLKTEETFKVTLDPFVYINDLKSEFSTELKEIKFHLYVHYGSLGSKNIQWSVFLKDDPAEKFKLDITTDGELNPILALKPLLKDGGATLHSNIDNEYILKVVVNSETGSQTGSTTKQFHFKIVDKLQASIEPLAPKSLGHNFSLDASKSKGLKQVISFKKIGHENWVVFIRKDKLYFHVHVDYPDPDALSYQWSLTEITGSMTPVAVGLESSKEKFAIAKKFYAPKEREFNLALLVNKLSINIGDSIKFKIKGNKVTISDPEQPKSIFFYENASENYKWKLYEVKDYYGDQKNLRLIETYDSPQNNFPIIYVDPSRTGFFKLLVEIEGINKQSSSYILDNILEISRKPKSYFLKIDELKRPPSSTVFEINIDASSSFSKSGIISYEWTLINKTLGLKHTRSTNRTFETSNLIPSNGSLYDSYYDTLSFPPATVLGKSLKINFNSAGFGTYEYEVSLRVTDGDKIESINFSRTFNVWAFPIAMFKTIPDKTEGAELYLDATESQGKLGKKAIYDWKIEITESSGTTTLNNFPNKAFLRTKFSYSTESPYKLYLAITDDFGVTSITRYQTPGFKVFKSSTPVIKVLKPGTSASSGDLVDMGTHYLGNTIFFRAEESIVANGLNASKIKYEWKLYIHKDFSNTPIDMSGSIDFTSGFGVYKRTEINIQRLSRTASTHTFNRVGLYEIRLIMTDEYGAENTASTMFGIRLPDGPIARIKTVSSTNAIFQFGNELINDVNVLYHWKCFPKSNPSFTPEVSILKLTASTIEVNLTSSDYPDGKYTIMLEAHDEFGRSNIEVLDFNNPAS